MLQTALTLFCENEEIHTNQVVIKYLQRVHKHLTTNCNKQTYTTHTVYDNIRIIKAEYSRPILSADKIGGRKSIVCTRINTTICTGIFYFKKHWNQFKYLSYPYPYAGIKKPWLFHQNLIPMP